MRRDRGVPLLRGLHQLAELLREGTHRAPARFLADAGGRSLGKPFSKEDLLAKVGALLG